MSKTRHLTLISLLTGVSLSLFLLEGLIPLPFLPPGAKLGLANIVTVLAFFLMPRHTDVLILLFLRNLLASFFGGGPTVFCYSFAGAIFSFFTMSILIKSKIFSLAGVSAAGGFMHNMGQIAVAAWLLDSSSLWRYMTILGPCGLFTGAVIGILCGKILAKLPNQNNK